MYVESLSHKLTHKLYTSKNLRAPCKWPTAEDEKCRSVASGAFDGLRTTSCASQTRRSGMHIMTVWAATISGDFISLVFCVFLCKASVGEW